MNSDYYKYYGGIVLIMVVSFFTYYYSYGKIWMFYAPNNFMYRAIPWIYSLGFTSLIYLYLGYKKKTKNLALSLYLNIIGMVLLIFFIYSILYEMITDKTFPLYYENYLMYFGVWGLTIIFIGLSIFLLLWGILKNSQEKNQSDL
ncbi:MAG: hypothetical protein WC402_01025 [Candidatus Pacearchaeota archaeon]|jgi:hypothetical protein